MRETAKNAWYQCSYFVFLVSQRKIPFVKCGRRTEFDIKDLDAWIEKNKTSEQKF